MATSTSTASYYHRHHISLTYSIHTNVSIILSYPTTTTKIFVFTLHRLSNYLFPFFFIFQYNYILQFITTHTIIKTITIVYHYHRIQHYTIIIKLSISSTNIIAALRQYTTTATTTNESVACIY